jgi:hypothetical protein
MVLPQGMSCRADLERKEDDLKNLHNDQKNVKIFVNNA